MTTNMIDQIVETTEARIIGTRDWTMLSDCPAAVRDTIAEEVLSATCRDMRHEPNDGNTDDAGTIEIDGQSWQYRR